MIWKEVDIVSWMDKTNEKIQANKSELTILDRNIGDGDHGINMSRGFQKMADQLQETTYSSVSAILKDVAMLMIRHIGGASGPLYGTAFLRLSLATENVQTIDTTTLAKGFHAATAGIKQRGKAKSGEKTLIDVWSPVTKYMNDTEEINPRKLVQVAELAMENTEDMQAKKGRAAYLKERSIGHIDPGAMSSYLLFQSFAEVLEGGSTT